MCYTISEPIEPFLSGASLVAPLEKTINDNQAQGLTAELEGTDENVFDSDTERESDVSNLEIR